MGRLECSPIANRAGYATLKYRLWANVGKWMWSALHRLRVAELLDVREQVVDAGALVAGDQDDLHVRLVGGVDEVCEAPRLVVLVPREGLHAAHDEGVEPAREGE